MIRLDPPIEVSTPQGKARAHFLIDYSYEMDLYWVCFLNENGECWTFNNKLIRLSPNYTAQSPKEEIDSDRKGNGWSFWKKK